MANPSKISWWKAIKYWAITFCFFALLFEMASSFIYKRRYATKKLASVYLLEKLWGGKSGRATSQDIPEKLRPDAPPALNRQIAAESWEANTFAYEPWLQFKAADFTSEYVNVNGFERKSSPSTFVNPSSPDTLEVLFLGGSTMYGYNMADNETIPSCFLRLYEKKYPQGQTLRVRNYGIPHYYSKQELLLLSKQVFEGKRPDIVVFLDGLTDFYPSRMLYYDRPYFSYAMQQVFDGKIFQNANASIIDTSDQLYIDPPSVPAEKYYDALLEKYLNNIRQASRLSERTGINAYFFCQPVPFYNYPNRDKDPVCNKERHARFDHIYPLLEKEADSIPNLVFLGNMLESENGLPFIDEVHYSPSFSESIAEKILLKIEKDHFKTNEHAKEQIRQSH